MSKCCFFAPEEHGALLLHPRPPESAPLEFQLWLHAPCVKKMRSNAIALPFGGRNDLARKNVRVETV